MAVPHNELYMAQHFDRFACERNLSQLETTQRLWHKDHYSEGKKSKVTPREERSEWGACFLE